MKQPDIIAFGDEHLRVKATRLCVINPFLDELTTAAEIGRWRCSDEIKVHFLHLIRYFIN